MTPPLPPLKKRKKIVIPPYLDKSYLVCNSRYIDILGMFLSSFVLINLKIKST